MENEERHAFIENRYGVSGKASEILGRKLHVDNTDINIQQALIRIVF